MFNSKILCVIWKIVNEVSGAMYPIAILLLSSSRTIAIVYPFYRIKKWLVVTVLYVYFFYLGLRQGMTFLPGFEIGYGSDVGYCYFYFAAESLGKLSDMQNFINSVFYALMSVEVAVPAVLTFISFLISLTKLLSKSTISSTQAQQRRAALTITIFTGVFQFCYIPFVALSAITVYVSAIYENETGFYEGPYSNYFVFWYAWPFTSCLLGCLNTLLDVMIYTTRMKDFRDWLAGTIRAAKESFITTFCNSPEEVS